MGSGRISEFYGPLLLYIVGLNVLIITSVALLHELGHAALGHWMGCGNIEIILFNSDVQSTFVRMTCGSSNAPSATFMFLSSFIFLLPLSSLFLVLGEFKEKYMGHIVVGISIMVAAMDVRLLTDMIGATLLTILLGAAIAIYGEERLVNGIIATEIASNTDYAAEKHKDN